MGHEFHFCGESLIARPSGALYWPDREWLVVADLHLGKSERYARRDRGLLPPYETQDTLDRLQEELTALNPKRLIFLGDSFDDDHARLALRPEHRARIDQMISQTDSLWITGNHDPMTAEASFLGGRVSMDLCDRLNFRHMRGEGPDISGHYHPVMQIAGKRWRCFIVTKRHLVLPAFGAYTGGLDINDKTFHPWARQGFALLCGRQIFAAPLPQT